MMGERQSPADKAEHRNMALMQQLRTLYEEIVERASHARPAFPCSSKEAEWSRDNLLAYLVLREHGSVRPAGRTGRAGALFAWPA